MTSSLVRVVIQLSCWQILAKEEINAHFWRKSNGWNRGDILNSSKKMANGRTGPNQDEFQPALCLFSSVYVRVCTWSSELFKLTVNYSEISHSAGSLKKKKRRKRKVKLRAPETLSLHPPLSFQWICLLGHWLVQPRYGCVYTGLATMRLWAESTQ